MDLSPYLGWIIFLHVLGAFTFALSHGVSMFAAFAIRGTREPARIATLLDLSGQSLGVFYLGLLVLLLAGITAGLIEGWRNWMWAAIVILVLVTGAMYGLGTTYYARVRSAVGLPSSREPNPPAPVSAEELDTLLSTRRPELLAAIGLAGLVALLYLMFFKPF